MSAAVPLPDIDDVTRLIARVAEVEILPRFRHLGDGEVHEKGPGDLVTVADREAEAHLSRELARLLPGSVVVGEEAVASDPTVLSRLDGPAPVWIVDPIDGTANFVDGHEAFGTMVALCQDDATLAAWIHVPIAGVTATATAGGGTLVDGRPVRIGAPPPLAEAKVTGTAAQLESYRRARLDRLAARVATMVGCRCAATDYIELVCGGYDLAVFTKHMPWDHVPGTLLHAEAGGYTALLDGRPYRPVDVAGPPLVVAPDRATYAQVVEVLAGDPTAG